MFSNTEAIDNTDEELIYTNIIQANEYYDEIIHGTKIQFDVTCTAEQNANITLGSTADSKLTVESRLELIYKLKLKPLVTSILTLINKKIVRLTGLKIFST